MSQIVECRGCGKKYRFKDTHAGTSIRCKSCGCAIDVPRRSRLGGGRPAAAPANNNGALIGSAVAIVVLLGVVAFLLLNRGSDGAPQQVAQNEPVNDAEDSTPLNRDRSADPSVNRAERDNSLVTPPATPPNSIVQFGGPATAAGSAGPGAAGTGLSVDDLPDIAPGTPPEVRDMIYSALQKSGVSSPGTDASAGAVAGTPSQGDSLPAGASRSTRSTRANAFGSAAGAEWSGGTIHFRSQDGLTFGPPGCPVVVSGQDVWDWEEAKITQAIQGEYDGRGATSISPDGAYFAATNGRFYDDGVSVHVWSTESGQQILSVPPTPKVRIDVIHVSNQRLFVGQDDAHAFDVYDLTTGEALSPLQLSDRADIDAGQSALTYDGKYLATPDDDRLVVLDTDTGRKAATMGEPKYRPKVTGESLIVRNGNAIRAGGGMMNALFVFKWMKSIAFSPDSEELAAVSTHPDPRLMCWSNRGKLIFDEPIYGSRSFSKNVLSWFPNRSAWLVDGDVFHRDSARVVLSVSRPFASDAPMHVLDDGHILGPVASNPRELSVIPIPWDRIHQSIEQIESKAPAILSPNQPVSVEVNLGQVRGGGPEVLQSLQLAIAQRLARDGMQVVPNQSTVFRLRFAEEAGDTLPIFERQNPFDLRGRDTGRTTREAKGTLVVELFAAGQQQPLWRDTIESESGTMFFEKITDQSVRQSMLEKMFFSIAALDFPYYLPESDEFVGLPIVIR